MTRREELLEYVKADTAFLPLIDEILFLEGQLVKLKKLPFLKIHPDNPEMQKATPAAKQYKELLQQYSNCLKIIAKASGKDFEDEESPLRKWVNMQLKGD